MVVSCTINFGLCLGSWYRQGLPQCIASLSTNSSDVVAHRDEPHWLRSFFQEIDDSAGVGSMYTDLPSVSRYKGDLAVTGYSCPACIRRCRKRKIRRTFCKTALSGEARLQP